MDSIKIFSFVNGLQTIWHDVKVLKWFLLFFLNKWIKNEKLKCLESIDIQPLLLWQAYISPGVKMLLNTSRDALHGLTLCAITVFNIIFGMTTSSLYPTHTIFCKVPQSSSEFQTLIQPQSPWRFSIGSQTKSMVKLLFTQWMVCQYTQSLQRYWQR